MGIDINFGCVKSLDDYWFGGISSLGWWLTDCGLENTVKVGDDFEYHAYCGRCGSRCFSFYLPT